MKSARLMCVMSIATVLVLFAGCQMFEGSGSTVATNVSASNAKPIAIHSQQQGNDSSLSNADMMLINSQAELDALNSTGVGAMSIDFASQSLIVLAMGEQKSGGYWAKISGVQKSGKLIYVQGTVNRPAAHQGVTLAMTYPYAAVVVDKVTGTLVPEVESVEGKSQM